MARAWQKEDLEVRSMLHMALVFLVIGLIAALLGFTTIAGAAFGIAKFLAGVFLVLFLVFLILGISATRRLVGFPRRACAPPPARALDTTEEPAPRRPPFISLAI